MEKEFVGVYSRTDKQKVKSYYFVWSADDLFSVQKLNAFFQPAEMIKTIDKESFHALFVHEPSINKYPKGKADFVPEKKKELLSSHKVEESLRELFRKALVRMRRENSLESAMPILDNLTTVEEGITPKHRHMFNDFGIEMRKKKDYPHALAFCKRTLALTNNDDHAHFNVARVLIEMGDYDEAEQHLLTAQFLNPDSRIYKKALEHVAMLRLQKEEMVIDEMLLSDKA